MTNLMKVLVAYDGSDSAKEAIEDLRFAGLPAKADVLVISVAEQFMPIPASFGMVETDFAENLIEGEKGAKEHVREACERLKAIFPEWTVGTKAGMGSPATFILEQADAWKPDLIVVGSHGRTALGRLILGSVSQKLVHEARSSVRVARRSAEKAEPGVRILVAVDGSKDSEEAAREVLLRQWPAGSEVRLVNATWAQSPAVSDSMLQPIAKWMVEERGRIKQVINTTADRFRDAGLPVSIQIKEGDAKRLLLEEAESWKADCLFVGARGMGMLERLTIGSVSSAVAARAGCSVEIVRRPK